MFFQATKVLKKTGKAALKTREEALQSKESGYHDSRHLSRAEPRHRGQDAESVAGEEEDAVGVATHARGLVVLDVVDGV